MMHQNARPNLPVLPCRHTTGIVDQVRPTRELLEGMDRLHPDVLQQHGINPPDYHGALVFRSAVEQIRGSYIARAMNPRQQHVAAVLGRRRASGRIVDFQYTGGARRCDFAVTVSQEPRWQAALEVKGGEGNRISISQRPLWADEFVMWCHLDGAIVNQPHEGAASVIFSRVSSELVRRQKRLDAVLFKDALCGTTTRPCPKYPDSMRRNEEVSPDIFLLPRRPPNLDDEPNPPLHDRQSLRLPFLLLEEFGSLAPHEQAQHIWEVSVRLFQDQRGQNRREVTVTQSGQVVALRRTRLWVDGLLMADQLSLHDQLFKVQEKLEGRLNPARWEGSFNVRECSFHQLAPYVGKLKSGMVRVLLEEFTKEGDVVLDPFCGSGVVPLEAALLNRGAIGNDLNPYAYALTMGKLFPPRSLEEGLRRARQLADKVESEERDENLSGVPPWVKEFFHPKTLRETVSAFRILRKQKDYFLVSCLLGILHHVRPGFLSYPASHLTPYLRKKMYPREEYPAMYAYRDLRSRLVAKVERAFSRPPKMSDFFRSHRQALHENAMSLPLRAREVDAVISSPPYFGALDYGRDNRLRLWFLGIEDYKVLDKKLTANDGVYVPQMSRCLGEMLRVLKPDGYCVLILGDVRRNGKIRKTAEIVCQLAGQIHIREKDGWMYSFKTYAIVTDEIPDDRRSRRNTKATKNERILIMKKSPTKRA